MKLSQIFSANFIGVLSLLVLGQTAHALVFETRFTATEQIIVS